MFPILSNADLSAIDDTIQKVSMNAALNFTNVPGWYVEQVKDEFLNEVRRRVWESYDPNRGGLTTFVHMTARHRIYQMWDSHVYHDKHFYTPKQEQLEDGNGEYRARRARQSILAHESRETSEPDPAESVVDAVWLQSLANERMNEQQQQVFGLMNSGITSQTEIGKRMGLSGERIRQIRLGIAKVIKEDMSRTAAV